MEKIEQKVFLILVFVSFAFLILIFILFWLKFYVDSQARAEDALLQQKEKEFAGSHFQEYKQIIVEINQALSRVKNFWNQQFFITPIFEELILLTPESIQFETFSLKKEETTAAVNVSGKSATRGALFYFKENLEQAESFAEVIFLPSSWMMPVNAEFSAAFKFIPQEIKKINEQQ